MHRLDRVVVTGGAGFIGSHLVDALLNRQAVSSLVVVDNLTRGRIDNLAHHDADPRLEFIAGDIRELPTLTHAFDGATAVFHLAAQATVMGAARDLDYTFATNVTGTYNVLKAAAERNVHHLVFSSSREVYGEPVTLPVDEGHPLLCINSYGASKVAGEALCRSFSRECKVETRILRIANAYGPRDIGRVIPHWMEQARQGKSLLVYGGQQVLDFVWVGDVVAALISAVTAEAPLPPINVASGTGTKILDLARRISNLSGGDSDIRVVPRRDIEVTRYVGNTERMTQFLGVLPAADPLAHLVEMIRPAAPALA